MLLFFAFFLSFSTYSQNQLISDAVKNHIQARVENGLNVGIVIGMIDGETTEYYSFGNTSVKSGIPVNEHTVFEIGSITKVFTTTLLADEVLKGHMALTDPASKYLPKSVTLPTRNGKEITLNDLATHTSALPRMPDNFNPKDPLNPYVDYTPEMMYVFLNQLELTRDIGEKYEYSNLGMGLLGHILEWHTGKTYETLIKERITTPCGMPNTALKLSDNMRNHLAYGHSEGLQVSNWDFDVIAAAGGIRSTAVDMISFLKANLEISKTPINPAMQLAHQEAYVNTDSTFNIGLGWHYENKGNVVWHNGRTGGYTSFTGFVEGSKKGVVVLSNAAENMNALGFHLLGSPTPLVNPQAAITTIMKKDIEANNVDSAVKLYFQTKKEATDAYRFKETDLNRLGYEYLSAHKNLIAIRLFQLTANEFPASSNAFDSLGEAYLKQGDTALAIANYKKSLELNPANQNAKDVLKSLNFDVSKIVSDVQVSEAVLDTYLGVYQLAPGFNITVTRDGTQLLAQATGQSQFKLYPSAVHKFYLKVVDAQVTFNVSSEGVVNGLTLHQNGQNMPGTKIE
ncbi:CubicO group peptidase, beta-lactamase class C family [Bizionia echini]|uniref:CubicO group peptidase, beta-lactamase class C family n=2 Tax=Bizionia echini TaxID=649333 RepID=A0A1I5C371_9FLAO|nr:CubicO group peptidase, beta-lactamase class C family [Bizionia echini]